MGYETTAEVRTGKYLALGVVFTDCSSQDLSIPNLFSYVEGEPCANADMVNADQIWRWRTADAKWTKYYYMSANRGKVKRWVMDGDTTLAEDGYIRETIDTIPVGETFFFLRNGDTVAKLNLSGAIKPFDAKAAFVVGPGKLAFAANPFPIAMNVKDFNSNYEVGEPCANADMVNADQIWCWRTADAKWTKYYFMSANRGKVKRWVKDGDTTLAEDGYIQETSDVIAAGEGFFFTRNGDDAATIKLGMPAAE